MASNLPAELLIFIFSIATYNTIRDADYTANPPFLAVLREKEDDKLNDEALKTKAAISTVCSFWRHLNLEFMYEDIIIRHGSKALVDVLENGVQTPIITQATTAGLGHFVRRIQLSTMYTAASGFDIHPKSLPWYQLIGRETARILRSCPNIIHLERRRDLYCRPSEFISDYLPRERNTVFEDLRDIQLTNIMRIDWDGGFMPQVYRNGIAESDNNYFPRCFTESQSLRVLALSGTAWGTNWRLSSPQLKTVYLNAIDFLDIVTLGSDANPKYDIPGLSRVVLRHRNSSTHPLIRANSYHIRTIEIDRNLFFLTPRGTTEAAQLLHVCPNLEELFYPVFFVRLMHIAVIQNSPLKKLRIVGLHAVPNPARDVSDIVQLIIAQHLSVLCSPESPFVALREIRLCGDEWGSVCMLEGFKDAESLVRSRGIMLVKEGSHTATEPKRSNVL